MGKKLSYDYVKNFIEAEGYKLLSKEYINSSQKLEVMCDKGHIYEVTFHNFKTGYRCKKCAGCSKYTYDEVKKCVESYGYTLISKEYKNTDSPIQLMCPEGHIWTTTFYRFNKKGNRCIKCAGVARHEYEEVKSYVEARGWEMLSKEYKNVGTPILLKCPNGHVSEIIFSNFMRGSGCSCCANNKRHDYEYVKKEIEKEGYKLISSEYINGATKIEMMCDEGHVFQMRWNNFQQGQRCPICQKPSKGEQRVEEILNKYSIPFETQYRYDDCRDVKPLPFDFYLPQYNLIIEFDGEQHFDIKHCFGNNDDDFWTTIIHDAIKNQYCEDNNINILRIPYWEIDNIEELIKNKLNI